MKAKIVPVAIPDDWPNKPCYHVQYKKGLFWHTLKRVIEGSDGGTVKSAVEFDFDTAKEFVEEFSKL